MSQVQYLIDENLPLSLVAGIRRAEPGIDAWRVGQPNMSPAALLAPPRGAALPVLIE
jgi:hypothetical protein